MLSSAESDFRVPRSQKDARDGPSILQLRPSRVVADQATSGDGRECWVPIDQSRRRKPRVADDQSCHPHRPPYRPTPHRDCTPASSHHTSLSAPSQPGSPRALVAQVYSWRRGHRKSNMVECPFRLPCMVWLAARRPESEAMACSFLLAAYPSSVLAAVVGPFLAPWLPRGEPISATANPVVVAFPVQGRGLAATLGRQGRALEGVRTFAVENPGHYRPWLVEKKSLQEQIMSQMPLEASRVPKPMVRVPSLSNPGEWQTVSV